MEVEMALVDCGHYYPLQSKRVRPGVPRSIQWGQRLLLLQSLTAV